MRKVALLAFALLALFNQAAADALFIDCPTVFNEDVSEVAGNMYVGSPPAADCGDLAAAPFHCNNYGSPPYLNVSIDGVTDDLLNCTCDNSGNVGSWSIFLSTPLDREYNITAQIVNHSSGSISAEYACIVKRASFEGTFTVPEFSILLLPLLMFTGLLILRRRK